MKLTSVQEKLLARLRRRGAPESGYAFLPQHISVLYRLERRGLTELIAGNWRITDAGRRALQGDQ